MKSIILSLLLLVVSWANAQQRIASPGGGDPHMAMPIGPYVGDQGAGIVDFSYAGYAANEHPIPEARVRVVVPNSAGDDGERIQAALDYVIHMTSGEYTGPLPFTQFWLDTIGQWEQETGHQVLTALSCTYDIQEAILNDPARAAVVDIIDIRYWSPRPDGRGSGPTGGINLSPRQQGYKAPGKKQDAFKAAVERYQQRFPNKAVICSDMGFQLPAAVH